MLFLETLKINFAAYRVSLPFVCLHLFSMLLFFIFLIWPCQRQRKIVEDEEIIYKDNGKSCGCSTVFDEQLALYWFSKSFKNVTFIDQKCPRAEDSLVM